MEAEMITYKNLEGERKTRERRRERTIEIDREKE